MQIKWLQFMITTVGKFGENKIKLDFVIKAIDSH
jgi:hypothetical protein